MPSANIKVKPASSDELRFIGSALCILACVLQITGMILNSSVTSTVVSGPFNVDVDCGPSQVRIQSHLQVLGPNGTVALPKIDTTCLILSQDCDAPMWDFKPTFPFPMTPAATKACHAVKTNFAFSVFMLVFLQVSIAGFCYKKTIGRALGGKFTLVTVFIAFTASGISNLTPMFGTKDFTNELDLLPFVETKLGVSAFIFMAASVLNGAALYSAYYLPHAIDDEEAAAQQKPASSVQAMDIDIEKTAATFPSSMAPPLQADISKQEQTPRVEPPRTCGICTPIDAGYM